MPLPHFSYFMKYYRTRIRKMKIIKIFKKDVNKHSRSKKES